MINVFLIALTIVVCLFFIINMIDDKILDENVKLLNDLKQYKNDNVMLYKVIKQIYNELSLLKLKDCPDEEFKNIPYELIDWLEQLGLNAKK